MGKAREEEREEKFSGDLKKARAHGKGLHQYSKGREHGRNRLCSCPLEHGETTGMKLFQAYSRGRELTRRTLISSEKGESVG